MIGDINTKQFILKSYENEQRLNGDLHEEF